jgi:Uma2 family endonuclease
MRAPLELAPGVQELVTLADQNYSEFLAAVDTYPDLGVELIDGAIIMTPAATPRHQLVTTYLLLTLGQHVHTQGLGRVLTAPVGVELAPESPIVQPDMVFISQERVTALVGEKRITGAPDLLVEILSPATARLDRLVKLPLYAACGVGEYWIVDMAEQAVEVYTLDGSTYRVAGIFLSGDTITAGRFAPVAIAVASLFAS